MGKIQQSVGKKWEEEIMSVYYEKGYYVEKRATGNTGTVYDILISKGGSCMFVEAKHIDSDKLYYKGSGLYKKRDELDNFVMHSNNNIYIFIKSEKVGTFWTTWLVAKPLFEEKGYITIDDCNKMRLELCK